jgi:hypothetical protein
MSRMHLRTSRARLLAAFAVALGVHLLLALAVAVAPRPRSPERARRLQVELRPAKPGAGARPQTGPEAAPEPPAGGQPVASAPSQPAIELPPAASERTETRRPRERRDRTAPPASAAPAEQGGPKARAGVEQPPPGAAGPERGSKEWLGAEGVARDGSGVSLRLRDPIGSLSGAPPSEPPQGPVRVPTPEEQLAEEKTRVAVRIGDWSNEILARQRADDPHDAYWRLLGDALAKGLDVDVGLGKLKVLVRIVQRDDGSVESADLANSSGNRAYDDRVVRQARDLGRTLLGPPPDGHRKTLWAFEVESLVFVAPLAGCALDSNFLPGECYYPFKKYVRPRVKLQAIY